MKSTRIIFLLLSIVTFTTTAFAGTATKKLEIKDQIDFLIQKLKSDKRSVRQDAAAYLAGGERGRVAGPLIKTMLEDKEWLVRAECAKSLGFLGGEEAIAALIRVSNSDIVSHVRFASVRALGKIGTSSSNKALIQLLKTEVDWRVRVQIVEIIGKRKSPEVILALEERIKNELHKKVRVQVEKVLGIQNSSPVTSE